MIGQTLGSYEVIAKLGEGGMGEVYRARDRKLGRDVALKILPAVFAADPERRARFEREAQVLASLNHTNIAAIYGFEEGSLASGWRSLPAWATRSSHRFRPPLLQVLIMRTGWFK